MERTTIEAGAELLRLTLSCRNIDRQVAGRMHLTVDEMHFLCELYLGHPACVKELSEALQISATRASKILHKLEQHGLVVRALHPSDRRMEQVSLSEEGKEIAETTLGCFAEAGAAFFLPDATSLKKQLFGIPTAIL